MSIDFQKLSFKLAQKNDIPKLIRTMVSAYNDLAQKYLNHDYGPPGYDAEYAHLKWMQEGNYYKIEYDGRIIGGFALMFYRQILYLNYFFIDLVFQGRGIGSQVLKYIDTLSTWCIEANTPSWAARNQEFYLKNGYRQVSSYFDKELGFTLFFYQKYKL
jgi:GNAT superfamily N-acetyltransferase